MVSTTAPAAVAPTSTLGTTRSLTPAPTTVVATARTQAPNVTVPAPGTRPAVGTPAPSLPATVRSVAAAVRSVGRSMRVEVSAPKGALVHVYRDGQLVTSVTPEEAKSLAIPANGAKPEDIQIVIVTRTGNVMSTPVPTNNDVSTSPGADASPDSDPSTPAATAPTKSTVPARRGANNARASTTTIQPKKSKTTVTKAGQRSTSDTTKPTATTNSGK